jgi:type III secretory pathway component EscS
MKQKKLYIIMIVVGVILLVYYSTVLVSNLKTLTQYQKISFPLQIICWSVFSISSFIRYKKMSSEIKK